MIDPIKVIREARVVPVITIDAVEDAVPLANALLAGGLGLIEVTLRTDAGLDAIAAIADSVPTICVGVGSVTSAYKAKKAIDAGARFLVSPGLDDGVVAAALARRVPLIPGVFTPTELMRAAAAGFDIVKLFPAEPGGGVATVKALSAVWPEVGFVPTGGITAENAPAYLAEPQVVAVGGSWMATRQAIAANDWETITALTAEAMQLGPADRGSDV